MIRIFIFVLFFIPLLIVGQDCTQCKKKLAAGQRYLKVEESYYCSEACFLVKRPACAECSKKKMNMIQYKKKFYCGQVCIEKVLPKCSMCKSSVYKKEYFTINDTVFCSKKCFHKTIEPCKVCGLKKDSVANIYKYTYCIECSNIERCKSCNLPAKGRVLPDGRMICDDCLPHGVATHEKAIELYAEIRRVMGRDFNMTFSDDLGFKLVSLIELKAVSDSFTGSERGLYHVSNEKTYQEKDGKKELLEMSVVRKIYLLDHLHENVFKKVCAHELAHNWQDIHYPNIKDKKIIEGVAEYFAFMICQKYGYDYLGELIVKNEDTTYGDGYRLVKSKENGLGLKGVITWLESENNK